MEKEKKDTLIILAAIIMLIITFFTVYKKAKSTNKVIPNQEPQIQEETKTHSPKDDDIPLPYEEKGEKEEEKKEEIKKTIIDEDKIYSKMGKKLKSMGYTEVAKDKRCQKNEKCFSNKTYFVRYDIKGKDLYIEKEVKEANFKKYNSKGDLLLIGKLLENEIIGTKNKLFNTILQKVNKKEDFDYLFIQTAGLNFRIDYSSNGILEYLIFSVDNPIEDYDFDSLALMLSYNKDYASKYRNFFYEYTTKKYKDRFPYYDLAFYYLDYGNNLLCDFNIEHNKYILETSYCHGGTSNTSYELRTRSNFKNQDTITIELRSELFEKKYKDLIEHDLKYLNKKLNTKFKLSKTDLNEIKELVKHEKDSYSFIIDHRLEVTIDYQKNSTFYKIKYLINN